MKREYILQHTILLENYLNKAHEFDRWFVNTDIVKEYIEESYKNLCIKHEKECDKKQEWVKVKPFEMNGIRFIVIDFGETKEIALCAKIILVVQKYPHYFTIERKSDYVYYLCEWRRSSHKTYFSVVNKTEYILERIIGVLRTVK